MKNIEIEIAYSSNNLNVSVILNHHSGELIINFGSYKKQDLGLWEVKRTSHTPLSYYRGVISITIGRNADDKDWLFRSQVVEYDFTPIPKTTPLLLSTTGGRHSIKFGGEARGVYSAAIFYCQNMSVTWEQAKKLRIIVVTASGHKKNGKWSYDTHEFSLAAGWEFKKITHVNSDRVDMSRGEDGLCEYFQLPKNIKIGEFCLAEGEKFQKLYESTIEITRKLSELDELDGGAEAEQIVEHRVGYGMELLIDGVCWDYVDREIPEKVEVLNRASDFFTLSIKPGCTVELIKGSRYNRFDESDCLYNRGYRRVNGLWEKPDNLE